MHLVVKLLQMEILIHLFLASIYLHQEKEVELNKTGISKEYILGYQFQRNRTSLQFKLIMSQNDIRLLRLALELKLLLSNQLLLFLNNLSLLLNKNFGMLCMAFLKIQENVQIYLQL